MNTQSNTLPLPDRSGFAAIFGTAFSLTAMLILVAGSAVHMMV